MAERKRIAAPAPTAAVPDIRTVRRVARAEQKRISADAVVDRRAREARLALELRQERQAAARRERQTRSEDRLARAEQRRARRQVVRERIPRVAERALFVLPILFPMAVAWVGQIQFAMKVMGWPLAGAVVFAAGFELSTAYVARLDWRSRAAGDGGILFRAATWAFAAGAALMNYWHAAGPGFAPTGEAVSYGLMSVTGVTLWELWSIYRHRTAMRAEGRLPAARPRFGLARWIWFRSTTHLAWLIALRDGHTTTEAAWKAAFTATETFGSVREARRAIRSGKPIPERLIADVVPTIAVEAAVAPQPDPPAASPLEGISVTAEMDGPGTSSFEPVAPAEPEPIAPVVNDPVALATQMESYARARIALGGKVTGAALDRYFGTHDYGRKVLRRITTDKSTTSPRTR